MKRKNRLWKRMAAFCLTVLTATGIFGVGAFAAPIQEKSGQITVSGVETGVQVTAYQVLDVNFDYDEQQPVEPEFTWKAETADWVRQNFPAYIGADGSVQDDFSKAGAEAVALFYDEMASEIKGGGDITLSPAGSCTGSGTISGLEMGGYLILIENGMKVYRPSVVNIVPEHKDGAWVMTSPSVTVKSSEPGIDKTVNEDNKSDSHNPDVSDSGAMGDTFNFDLRTNVPAYPENAAAKGYVISDTLPAGLALVNDSIKVYGVSSGGQETALNAGDAYTLGTDRPGNKGTASFVLTFVYDKIKGYEKIHVDYNAVLTADANVGPDGNVNNAALDYSNNPYDAASWKEKTDEVTVYTYGLKVDKVNNSGDLLDGAEFTLSVNENGTDAMYFVKIGDGTYRAADSTEAGATQTLAVGAAGSAKGKLQVSGLAKADVLYLTETKAPDAYNKLSIPVQLEIKDADNNGKPTNGDSAEYGDGYVAVQVINTQGFQLPVTGGMGTVLFTAGGIAVMGAAVLLFITLRRRKMS